MFRNSNIFEKPLPSLSTALLLLWALTLILPAGCNSTPTVPVPPPEMNAITVTSPDINGVVTVNGDPGAAYNGDIIMIFNEDSGAGVMVEAMADGSFEASLEAQIAHQLLVQIKRDNLLSGEQVLDVPAN